MNTNFQKNKRKNVTRPHGECYEKNRKRNMSYKGFLQGRIRELEEKIATSTHEKEALQAALNQLRLAEFEEDMRTEEPPNQELLKG